MLLDCDPITGVGQAAIAGPQIAERDIWMQEGWPWLGLLYPKTALGCGERFGSVGSTVGLRWGLRWIPTIRGAGTVEEAGAKANLGGR